MPQILLATEKAAISPLFRAMSVRFKDRLKFAAMTGPTAAELQGELGLERLPGIVLLPARGDAVTYSGEHASTLHLLLLPTWVTRLETALQSLLWGQSGSDPAAAQVLQLHAGQAKAAELIPFLEKHALPQAASAGKGPRDPAALDLGPVNMTHLGEVDRLAEAPGAWLIGLVAGALPYSAQLHSLGYCYVALHAAARDSCWELHCPARCRLTGMPWPASLANMHP